MSTLYQPCPVEIRWPLVLISTCEQTLVLLSQTCEVLFSCSVSTALNGDGNQKNSGKTPLGWHQIRAKIGEGAEENTIFKARRVSGIYDQSCGQGDWILTRILWLSGLEQGVNRLGDVDTMQRYIYIHGTPDSEPMGVAKSHGCIRMNNNELVSFFNQVSYQSMVYISPSPMADIQSQICAGDHQ